MEYNGIQGHIGVTPLSYQPALEHRGARWRFQEEIICKCGVFQLAMLDSWRVEAPKTYLGGRKTKQQLLYFPCASRCYIYQHLPKSSPKCRQIFHTWSMWALGKATKDRPKRIQSGQKRPIKCMFSTQINKVQHRLTKRTAFWCCFFPSFGVAP